MAWKAGVFILAAAALAAPAGAQEGAGRSADYHAITARLAQAGAALCTTTGDDGQLAPCNPTIRLTASGAVGAWSRLGTITYTRGALARLDPDEFALLAGHELAHWYLGHLASTLEKEAAADRLGAALACRAGYDPARGARVFRFVGEGKGYPRRVDRIAAVLKESCAPALAAR